MKVVVDNSVVDERYLSSWGLSVYLELYMDGGRVYRLLFDLDTDYNVLMHNMSVAGLKLGLIDSIFISHWHSDHAGPLSLVLGELTRPVKVFVPSKPGFWSLRKWREWFVECSSGRRVVDGVYSTGSLGYGLKEHALVVDINGRGLVVVGCSHPGVSKLLEKAIDVARINRVALIIGGFHLMSYSEGVDEAERIKSLGVVVEKIAPIHCTSIEAVEGIRSVFGEKVIRAGSGYTIAVS